MLGGQSNSVDDERLRRLAVMAHIAAKAPDGIISAQETRSLGIYGGQQGVWVDVNRTRPLSGSGIAVGLRHTGEFYDDDLNDTAIIYHYPRTLRGASRDRSEIDAIIAAERFQIPVFVISNAPARSGLAMRKVQLGWVLEHDDAAEIAYVLFADAPPTIEMRAEPDVVDFVIRKRARELTGPTTRLARNPRFVFDVFKRCEGGCVLSGIRVPQMLEAAHVVPVAHDGPDVSVNGLLLNAALHRAFDKQLWTIEPETGQILTAEKGPTPEKMGIRTVEIPRHILPDARALEWRYREFEKHWKN
ncbi:MAG: HNH endonuclease [Acidimicrobiia bacterium]